MNEITDDNFVSIDRKKDLNLNKITEINPEIIFFPHWSYIIPKEIYNSFNCIIFHMTDLPFGRGGSPLQNLIVRGHKSTMISAIRCVKEVDGGPIYIKKPLSLYGSAQEIFIRANKVIEKMIIEIIKKKIEPKPQLGDVITFLRRKPEDGNLINTESLNDIYNYIRMLDAEGYPPAFINFKNYKLQFTEAIKKNGSIEAKVRLVEEIKNE